MFLSFAKFETGKFISLNTGSDEILFENDIKESLFMATPFKVKTDDVAVCF